MLLGIELLLADGVPSEAGPWRGGRRDVHEGGPKGWGVRGPRGSLDLLTRNRTKKRTQIQPEGEHTQVPPDVVLVTMVALHGFPTTLWFSTVLSF